uniref:Uncharacterized protein n=1 Tax=Romanomermis culicivorax TaxID=13658 RepID=A0A915HLE3_ROMCU
MWAIMIQLIKLGWKYKKRKKFLKILPSSMPTFSTACTKSSLKST